MADLKETESAVSPALTSEQPEPSPPAGPPIAATPPRARRPEFTLRAVLVSVVVAVLIGASYPLIVLKLGFGPNISVVSAFFGYLLLSAIGVFTGARANKLENNLVQTAGTTAGQAGFMCVLLAAFDMLNAKEGLGFSVHLTWLQTFLWLTVAGMLGVLLAVPLRRHYIDEENLTFADGVASAETLLVLEDTKTAKSRALALGAGILTAGLQTWLQIGLPKWLRVLPEATFFGAGGKALKLGMSWSLLSFGAGMLIGLRITLSMGLGMVVAWVVLPGPLFSAGAISEVSFAEAIRWVMWPATGMMVSGGLVSLALKWRLVAKTFTSLHVNQIGGSDFPIRWVVIGSLVLSVLLCVQQYFSLGMPVWITLVSLLLSVPLMLVGIRVFGETNWAPISAMANMMQGIFAILAPGHVAANMVASGMSGSVAGNGEMLMQDYKAGKMLGSSNRHLTYIQLMSVPIGSLAVALIYPVLRDRYGVVDRPGHPAELSSPISVKWAGFAELLSKGLDSLPPGCGWALIAGCVLGGVIAVLEPKYRNYLPSPTGVGIGMLIPAVYMMPMIFGGIAQYVWSKARPEQEQAYSTPLASGWIAGEALVAVALAIIAAVALAFGLELGG